MPKPTRCLTKDQLERITRILEIGVNLDLAEETVTYLIDCVLNEEIE